jgi:nucleolar GTP-binding protein
MSNVTEEGLMDLRNEACDRLLLQRVEAKLRTQTPEGGIMNRLQVAMPKPRDDKVRAAYIPEAVLRKREAMQTDDGTQSTDKKKLERHIEEELGDDYILDLKKNYDLPDDEKYDVIPEIWQGHNVADFIDANLKEKLNRLREEERLREAAGVYDSDVDSDNEEVKGLRRQAALIRSKQLIMAKDSHDRNTNKSRLPRVGRKRDRSASRLEQDMGELGVNIQVKRMRHLTEATEARNAVKKIRVGRSLSAQGVRPAPRNERIPSKALAVKVRSIDHRAQKPRNQEARKGEGDRRHFNLRPKHLFSGKRGAGKTDRR